MAIEPKNEMIANWSGIPQAQAANQAESSPPETADGDRESDALRQPFYEACTSYDYGSRVQQYLASRLLGRLETVCPHIVR